MDDRANLIYREKGLPKTLIYYVVKDWQSTDRFGNMKLDPGGNNTSAVNREIIARFGCIP